MRYHRMKLVNKDLMKLRKKTVVIVGCGSLGSRAASLLARWGINLVLIDFDKVHEANLGTQDFCEADLGNCKVKCLKKRIKEINSKVKVKAVDKKLTEKNIKLLESDLVIDATDNLKTRFLINEVCKWLKIPWIYAALEKNKGVVGMFGSKYGFDKIISRKANVCMDCDAVGVTPEIAAIISGIQVSKAVKYLSGQRVKRELIFIDLDSLEIEKIKNNYF